MRRRAFGSAAAILFLLSCIFPVGAGLVRNPTILPRWWGTVDVTLAFMVAVAALGIQGLAHGLVDKRAEQTTYRIYRSLIHALLAVGVLVMLGGDRINWANCATGFLWPHGYCTFSHGGLPSHAAQNLITLMRTSSSKVEN